MKHNNGYTADQYASKAQEIEQGIVDELLEESVDYAKELIYAGLDQYKAITAAAFEYDVDRQAVEIRFNEVNKGN